MASEPIGDRDSPGGHGDEPDSHETTHDDDDVGDNETTNDDNDDDDVYRSICSLSVDHGADVCRDSEERFYYDMDVGECKSFDYSGCGGNQNHFWTMVDCEQFCSKCMWVLVGV